MGSSDGDSASSTSTSLIPTLAAAYLHTLSLLFCSSFALLCLYLLAAAAVTRPNGIVELIFIAILRPFGRVRSRFLQFVWGHYYIYVGPDQDIRTTRNLPEKDKSLVRVVCISDTHLLHERLQLPPGDLLLHCGDVLLMNRAIDDAALKQLRAFAAWMSAQPFKHKVLIGGNHDGALAKLPRKSLDELFAGSGVAYLQDESLHLLELSLHGSPISVGKSANCAFQPISGYDELAATAAIPEHLDILMTHGPPGEEGEALGRASVSLRERVATAQPRYHIFGHNHLAHGLSRHGSSPSTLFVNASSADAFFALTHAPIVLDVKPVGRR